MPNGSNGLIRVYVITHKLLNSKPGSFVEYFVSARANVVFIDHLDSSALANKLETFLRMRKP
jgi:hypothetical protein